MVAFRKLIVLIGLVAAASIGVGCGGASAPRGTIRSLTSSAFAVRGIPAGWDLASVGIGTAAPRWSSDSSGTDEPYTVLSGTGAGRGSEVVVVSTTGFEGYEGGLAQASAAYTANRRAEEFVIDGQRALYAPATDDRWADLVAVRGHDIAVRVTSPHGTQNDLASLLARVVLPADRSKPPTLDPPGGMRLAGSVNAIAVLAGATTFAAGATVAPGPERSHAAAWLGPTGKDSLVVLTIPGSSADVAAIAAYTEDTYRRGHTSRARDVGGRPGVVVTTTERDNDEYHRLSVWAETDWGDLMVVNAEGGSLPTEDQLVAIAASARRATPAEWAAFEATAGGADLTTRLFPELRRGDGSVIALGTFADGEWGVAFRSSNPPGGAGKYTVDVRMALAGGGAGGVTGPDVDAGTGDAFVVFDTLVSSSGVVTGAAPAGVATVEVTYAGRTAKAAFAPVGRLPHGARFFAVKMDDPLGDRTARAVVVARDATGTEIARTTTG